MSDKDRELPVEEVRRRARLFGISEDAVGERFRVRSRAAKQAGVTRRAHNNPASLSDDEARWYREVQRPKEKERRLHTSLEPGSEEEEERQHEVSVQAGRKAAITRKAHATPHLLTPEERREYEARTGDRSPLRGVESVGHDTWFDWARSRR
eukprot:tig00020601_g11714.t1